ncbi:MAG TPA: peptidoglycan DD-metalloendopeptidase family protein [Candidatus Eubacterium faecavium]|nr:peptidoglycan DD-metalloendopeptidase family protein [Candidatus Eubacterium faecavium]
MRSKRLIRVLCVVFSFMMVFASAFSVQAKSRNELNNEKDKIESEIADSKKKINSLKSQKADKEEYASALMEQVELLQDKLDNLEDSRDSLQSEINAVEKQIAQTQTDIDKAQKEIEAKEKEFEGVYEEYCQRLRAMYISGNVSVLEVLLESGDISSILTRAEMVKSVSEQDSATLDELMTKMQEIQKQRQELSDKKLQLNEDKETLNTRKKELQASIDEYNSSKAELDDQIEECNAAIRSIESTEAEIQETIEDNEAELAAINEALSSSTNRPGSDDYNPGTGQLAYPTSYRKISAGYPNYSSGAYHGGVDWPCPTGTAVHASDSGVVVIAKRLTYSYGQYILIDHGNGLSTLYAHNSSLVVEKGDKVSKGQIIAYSGETGNATGPHVHFEVRLNGTRVNPMNYL